MLYCIWLPLTCLGQLEQLGHGQNDEEEEGEHNNENNGEVEGRIFELYKLAPAPSSWSQHRDEENTDNNDDVDNNDVDNHNNESDKR